jgi:hypothetical protein
MASPTTADGPPPVPQRTLRLVAKPTAQATPVPSPARPDDDTTDFELSASTPYPGRPSARGNRGRPRSTSVPNPGRKPGTPSTPRPGRCSCTGSGCAA